jgi:asparagine synthase (glutamine-hydrolysing)
VSGIVGIFHRDGSPVSADLIESLTGLLAYRDPDCSNTWRDGVAALGHAMLRTAPQSSAETQPMNLASRLWITADARLDDRCELIRKLKSLSRDVSSTSTDPELILHAYDHWRETCVDFLRGDFAFALWDQQAQTMFCARDHFGIKPLYFSPGIRVFIVSNTLDCIRRHPEVSANLNEDAVADFLLFGVKQNPAATTFRDIQRVPPAHTLTLSAKGWSLRRYWSPAVDGCIRYPRESEYVEHFQDLLEMAVADRSQGAGTGTGTGIFFSGGLDSSSVAVTAQSSKCQASAPINLHAYTFIYERLIPDSEKKYASEAATFLKIPINFLPLDDMKPFDRWDDPRYRPPEPVDGPFFAAHVDAYRRISETGKVVLSGEGADNLMHFQMWPHLRSRCRAGELPGALDDAVRFLAVRRFPWRGLRYRLGRALGFRREADEFPPWIAPDFSERTDLRQRWRDGYSKQLMPNVHPARPDAYQSLGLPQWTSMFELDDPGVTRQPLEVRYPFLDLRVVEFLLAIPTFPWCFHKKLLRDSLKGKVPEPIRLRPKTPLPVDPLQEHMRAITHEEFAALPWSDVASNYMDRSLLAKTHGSMNHRQVQSIVRALCLNLWLLSHSRSF